ncbi:hypothetical protein ACFL6K_05265 [Candidatus Latescibacterota bacterium]
MLEFLLYSLAVLSGIFIIMVLLPVKMYVHSKGGSEEQLEVSGRIMIFSGLLGGGLLYRIDSMNLSFFLLSWNVLSFEIKPFVKKLSNRPKKKKEKKEPLKKEKVPLTDRIKSYYGKAIKHKEHFSLAMRDIFEIIKIEQFTAYVNFGFGNPALTGKLIGVIFIVNSVLPKPYKITQSWDFTKTTLNGELDAQVTFFSHIFWKKLILRMPLIISIVREHIKEKQFSDNTLAIQEV